jgi:arylsulfatase A-like enzyme
MNHAKGKPNVIVFFTDQQRWDTTGVHGNPLGLTPHFDRMAARGTHLYNSFTCQPVCGPARSALQTGLYPTTTGCFRNSVPLPEGTKTLGHYFRESGYKTAYIGKWHLAAQNPVTEPRRGGYEYWLASNSLEATSDAYHTIVYNNDNEEVKLPGYRVDALTDAAIRYIDANQEEPFYMFLSFLEPHHQNHRDDYPAPEGYENTNIGRWMPPDLAALGGNAHQSISGYCGMVKRLDEALGRILDTLRSLDLEDNTIVLFTSDHGCHFKTRNKEYKRSCHESSIRVPTAITGPGFRAGGQIRELVSLIDLTPTLLDAAGIPVPEELQGRSIMPLLGREETEWPQEMFIQFSEDQVGRAVRTQRWKYSVIAPEKNPRDDAGSDNYTDEYLYDLYADPYELNNLIGLTSHQEVVEVLRQRLNRRMVEAGESAVTFTSAPERKAGQKRVSSAETLL